MKIVLLTFLLSIFSLTVSAEQDDCGMLPSLQARVDHLHLMCSATPVKCRAGSSLGLGAEEAVANCVASRWSDRQGCLNTLSCDGMTVGKCWAGSSIGLNAEEALNTCVASRWSDRSGCLNTLRCEGILLTKCTAGSSIGLNAEDAISACVESRWSDRQGCLSTLQCTTH